MKRPRRSSPRLQALLDRVDHWRLSDADHNRSKMLYHVTRGGLRVYAATAEMLGWDCVARLQEYIAAQYARIGFIDVDRLIELLDASAPLTNGDPHDIYVVATTDDGEVLCTAALRTLPGVSPATRMRCRSRPLFHVEQIHGIGVFDRLRVLPDLPAARVRDLGGFVKSHRPEAPQKFARRAPVEIGVALFRMVSGPLWLEVDAIIGDLEESVAKLNLDFFGVASVLVPGTLPSAPPRSLLAPRYAGRAVYPFAIHVSDIAASLPRLDAIEHALRGPEDSLNALMRFPSSLCLPKWSTLTPEDPGATLAMTPLRGLPHATDPILSRAELDALATDLRRVPILACLSQGEAAVLGSMVDEITAPAGEVVIHQGDVGDALYLVAAGEAVVTVDDGRGGTRTVGRLGPGDHFGEVAVVMGVPRTATVVAETTLRLWRIGSAVYRRYLEEIHSIDRAVSRTAAQRVYMRLRESTEGHVGLSA